MSVLAKINGTEIVADEGVAWLDADTGRYCRKISPLASNPAKLCETHRGLDCGDQAQLVVAGKHVPFFGSGNRPVSPPGGCEHRRKTERAPRGSSGCLAESGRKLGLGPSSISLRPSIADAVGEMMGQALVDVDQQAVVLGIPTRRSFKNRSRLERS